MAKPRVMYLDVDDTLLVWTHKYPGYAAPKAAGFVNWALAHFEVRWLTMWCPSGQMSEDRAVELSLRFNKTVDWEVFYQDMSNPKPFVTDDDPSFTKTTGIDFDDPRPWVWIEDGALPRELNVLRERRCLGNFYRTNVSTNVMQLQITWKKLAERFELPGAPVPPYSKRVIEPELMNEQIDKLTGSFLWPK